MAVYMTGLPKSSPLWNNYTIIICVYTYNPTPAEKPPILKFYLNSTSTSVFAVRFFFNLLKPVLVLFFNLTFQGSIILRYDHTGFS